jgi:hypothetical protein
VWQNAELNLNYFALPPIEIKLLGAFVGTRSFFDTLKLISAIAQITGKQEDEVKQWSIPGSRSGIRFLLSLRDSGDVTLGALVQQKGGARSIEITLS